MIVVYKTTVALSYDALVNFVDVCVRFLLLHESYLLAPIIV